uniref:cholesterol 25-hydroxylase-like protein 1, member 2 n=1 Tax=Myxine glutinosa TaxID=7769 RepID=UPI00358F0583
MVIGPSQWRVPRPQILAVGHRSPSERECVVHTLLLSLFFVLPAAVLQSVLRTHIELPSRAPTILELGMGLMASLLLFDTQYFVWHGLHHVCPGLYRSVHAKHHQDHSGLELPISLAHLLPWGLYGGPAYHDKHHKSHKWHLAPYFIHWDRLAGTLAP